MILSSIWRSNFFIRLRSWEYWPFQIVYLPVIIYWIFLSIRARSFFYFSASNPFIESGGMIGESKMDILKSLPQSLIPHTEFINAGCSQKELEDIAREFHYPIICKPDVGERGWQVEKISNKEELVNYHQSVKSDYLIQECLTEPIELGVFYYRYPGDKKGNISSIVIKEMLNIVGDGHSSIKELILKNDRAKLQWPVLKEKFKDKLDAVPNSGEEINLVAIGNHSRGTKFLDGNHLINEKLVEVFTTISNQIDGFYYGRYDIRVNSIEDLYKGNIKIMELNGAGSEPAHIYQPGYSLFYAYKIIFRHWNILFQISRINNKKGIPYLSFNEALTIYKRTKASK